MHIDKIRSQFPILASPNPISYLDNAASSQKPQRVIDRTSQYYAFEHANVHRGVYKLAEKATAEYEKVRAQAAAFLGGVDKQEIIFTSGTTQSINLIAQTWGRQFLKEGDEILLTIAEHHSNIVPWQMLAASHGLKIKFIPLDENFRLDLQSAKRLLSKRTKLLAFAHVSNVLGVIHPVKELIKLAKEVGAVTVIDGAQSIPHFDVNVRDLGCDFYAFSSHKMCGPTGVGVLYGRKELLSIMPPYQGGGEMIAKVSVDGFTPNVLPFKFEAGTPNIAGVIGLGEALAFLKSFDRAELLAADLALSKKFLAALSGNKNIKVFLTETRDWVGVLSFHHSKIHPHDIASMLDMENVCVRAGHHCAQPLMTFLNVPATTRVSPYLYNNEDDLNKFLVGMEKAEKLFT